MATAIPTPADPIPAVAPRVIRTSGRKRKAVTFLADDYSEALESALNEVDEDARVESAKDETHDDDDRDGSFLGHTEGKRLRKKAKATPKVKKTKAVKPFRFMDLPAELRDEIYELALIEPQGIVVVSTTKNNRRTVTRGAVAIEESSSYRGKKRRLYNNHYFGHQMYNRPTKTTAVLGQIREAKLSPNLCVLNKQIREEASSILYKQEIILEDTTALYQFLTTIGPYNRRMLSELTVKGWGAQPSNKSHNFAAFTAMTECVNLQSVFLDCSIPGYHRSMSGLARSIYKEACYFLEAYGAAHGSYDAGVDVLEMSDFHFCEKNNKQPTFSQEKYDEFEAALRYYLKR